MAKKSNKSGVEIPREGDAANLFAFWREIVTGRLSIETDDGEKKEILVPREVRIRASELLAKHVIPKGGKIADDVNEDDVETTPDILRVAQMLENKAADDQLTAAFALVRKRSK